MLLKLLLIFLHFDNNIEKKNNVGNLEKMFKNANKLVIAR